eukprot:3323686-Karenia_brevis.AAC.1
MVQYRPDLDGLGQPYTNPTAWIAYIKAHVSNRAWCSCAGKIHRRQHAPGIDAIRGRVHAIAVTKKNSLAWRCATRFSGTPTA